MRKSFVGKTSLSCWDCCLYELRIIVTVVEVVDQFLDLFCFCLVDNFWLLDNHSLIKLIANKTKL